MFYREEVHERLNGTCDGTYLVRRATSYSRCGDFTLTLRLVKTNNQWQNYRLEAGIIWQRIKSFTLFTNSKCLVYTCNYVHQGYSYG